MAKDGQLSIMAKAPIWHMSLNHVWSECPTCGVENRANERKPTADGQSWYTVNYEKCPVCGQLFDWSDEAIEKACKYSKDYPKNDILRVAKG